MELLLDTHAFIWFINGDSQLPEKTIEKIKDIKVKCFVSVASIWEIAIKMSLGKLELNGGFDDLSRLMKKYDIEVLPISFEHIQKLINLEFHHRDPFDRIIICQSLVERFTIVSKDENFPKYKVKIMWNK